MNWEMVKAGHYVADGGWSITKSVTHTGWTKWTVLHDGEYHGRADTLTAAKTLADQPAEPTEADWQRVGFYPRTIPAPPF